MVKFWGYVSRPVFEILAPKIANFGPNNQGTNQNLVISDNIGKLMTNISKTVRETYPQNFTMNSTHL